MPCCCAVQLSVGLTAAGLHCVSRRRVQACTTCAGVHPSAARDASSGESHATATKHSSLADGCVINVQELCNCRDAFRGAQLGVRLRGKQSAVIVASRGAFCACGADSSHGPSTHRRCAHWQTHCGACFALHLPDGVCPGPFAVAAATMASNLASTSSRCQAPPARRNARCHAAAPTIKQEASRRGADLPSFASPLV